MSNDMAHFKEVLLTSNLNPQNLHGILTIFLGTFY
jgi:hypothetical protein